MDTPITIYSDARVRRPSPRSRRRTRLTLLIAAAMVLLFSGLAQASINTWINGAEAGVLIMRDGKNNPLPATSLNTDVDMRISGPIAQVTLKQQFHNSGGSFIEGLYIFPLPENAAVHAMELRIGERIIKGEIHEKAEAKRIFEKAKAEGKRTGLVELRRANVFTTRVANIAPGDTIDVMIRYTEVLARDGNQFSLRFPMTLTPRYQPALDQAHVLDVPVGTPIDTVMSLASELGQSAHVPDVSGDFYRQGATPVGTNQARLRVQLDAGLPVTQLFSRSHQITTREQNGRTLIDTWDANVPMDRDFLLQWSINPGSDTAATVFTDTIDGEHFLLLMLVPPRQVSPFARLPREMIFIIDTSGSMGGESIRQARDALSAALDRLHPGDRFNIIEFDDRYSTLFPQPVPVADDTLSRARWFVNNLDAGGGTEMLDPLEAAMAMHPSEGYLRQILFITDGAVGNEHGIFNAVHKRLGDARLFTVGIGSAPNSFFMKKAAQFGRGTYTYITDTGEVQQQMSALFAKLEKPMMRDIALELPAGTQAQMFPGKVPDLYAGEPVMVAMKVNRIPATLTVRGNGVVPWQQTVRIADDRQHPGTAILWAREKIETLMDRITRGEQEDAVKPEIIKVALRHKLVSRYTSFVAVDHTPVRPAGESLKQQAIANSLPKGLNWPQTATGVDLLRSLALWLLLLSGALAWHLRSTRHATA